MNNFIDLLKLIRVKQWTKQVLFFLPILSIPRNGLMFSGTWSPDTNFPCKGIMWSTCHGSPFTFVNIAETWYIHFIFNLSKPYIIYQNFGDVKNKTLLANTWGYFVFGFYLFFFMNDHWWSDLSFPKSCQNVFTV